MFILKPIVGITGGPAESSDAQESKPDTGRQQQRSTKDHQGGVHGRQQTLTAQTPHVKVQLGSRASHNAARFSLYLHQKGHVSAAVLVGKSNAVAVVTHPEERGIFQVYSRMAAMEQPTMLWNLISPPYWHCGI